MYNMTDVKLRNVLKQKYVSLFEIKAFFAAICLDSSQKDNGLIAFAQEFSEYVCNYNNVIKADDFCSLFKHFLKSVNCDIPVEIKAYKLFDQTTEESFVKSWTYDLFYYNLWPTFIQAMTENYLLGETNISFRYTVSKVYIEREYSEYEHPIKQFQIDLDSIMKANYMKCLFFEKENNYVIQIEI